MNAKKTPSKPATANKKLAPAKGGELDPSSLDKVSGGSGGGIAPIGPVGRGG
jgi:hypothetical protein